MTIDSVGVSNTAGYSFTGGDPVLTPIVGMNSITPYTQMGGGSSKRKSGKRRSGKNRKKTKQRRSISKRVRLLAASKLRGVKKSMRKKSHKHHHTRRMKHRKAREDIIKSVELGLPISKKSSKQLSPSMQSFLNGIETATKSGSVIKFSDFKSDPGKKKSKSKSRSKSKKKGQTRGGYLMKGGGYRNCKSCGHFHRGGCDGIGCKRKKKKKKTSLFSWF